MELKAQKRIAGVILKCSPKRIRFDPDRLSDIKESITKVDIKSLINDKAVFAMQQAVAVAQILLATQVASAAALAPPPLGLGPVAGIPLAAAIKTSGYINAAFTAALAIGQVAGLGSTGDVPAPSGGGTYESPIVTTPAESQERRSGDTIKIYLNGIIVTSDEYARDHLIDSINKGVKDGKVLLATKVHD